MKRILASTLRKSSLLLNHAVVLFLMCYIVYSMVMSKDDVIDVLEPPVITKIANKDYIQVKWRIHVDEICDGTVDTYLVGVTDGTLSSPLTKQPIFHRPTEHAQHKQQHLNNKDGGVTVLRNYSLIGIDLTPGDYILYVKLSSYCYGFGLFKNQQYVSIKFSI